MVKPPKLSVEQVDRVIENLDFKGKVERIRFLEAAIDDAVRSLNMDDKHGALGCLRACYPMTQHEKDTKAVPDFTD